MSDQFSAEYDELINDIQGSGYQTFPHNLRRWFSFLDASANLAGIFTQLESSVDFKSWYEKCLNTRSSMAGSARLEWPAKPTQQLGLKVKLFRSFADGNIQPHEFCSDFLYIDGNLDEMVSNIVRQLFCRWRESCDGTSFARPSDNRLFRHLSLPPTELYTLITIVPRMSRLLKRSRRLRKLSQVPMTTRTRRIKSSVSPNFQQHGDCLLRPGFVSVP